MRTGRKVDWERKAPDYRLTGAPEQRFLVRRVPNLQTPGLISTAVLYYQLGAAREEHNLGVNTKLDPKVSKVDPRSQLESVCTPQSRFSCRGI